MSITIIEIGWNIGSLLKCYKDVDFTFKHNNLPLSSEIDDFLGVLMFNKYNDKFCIYI